MTTIVGQATAYARRTVVFALSGATIIVSLILIERSVFDRYSYAASERMLEAHAVTNKIALAHERLTLAANMAAVTAEQSWIDSYARHLCPRRRTPSAMRLGDGSPGGRSAFRGGDEGLSRSPRRARSKVLRGRCASTIRYWRAASSPTRSTSITSRLSPTARRASSTS